MKLHKLRGTGGYTTFGCMWDKGKVNTDSGYSILSEEGKKVACQSRITAYWPDGSVKWSSHTADSELLGNEFTIENSEIAQEESGITVDENEAAYTIDNGFFRIYTEKKGRYLFESVTSVSDGTALALNAAPELILTEPIEVDGEEAYVNHQFTGSIAKAEIEEKGALRCIVRFTGTHVNKNGLQRLSFIIRMAVYKNSPELTFTHTFLYDGDENKDFLKGIGVVFERPMEGALYNRHVKFAGDYGTFHESVITMQSWRPGTPVNLAKDQMAGVCLNPSGDEKTAVESMLKAMPYWNEYDICQDSVSHFGIRKKQKGEAFSYIEGLHGNRAKGGFSVGSENGYVEVGMKDFFEKYPSGYNVKGLIDSKAEIHIWLWSPTARPMDFRHYADRGYNQVCYEGYDYKGADPYGIACTNEFSIKFGDAVIPSDEELLAFSENVNNPTLYVMEPKEYHRLHAFGHWSLISENTDTEKWLEKQLENAFEFYKNEVETRSWYGMFNYGDFMHTYDFTRHTWRYDVGGYAWDNTELVPTLWLWFYFLRTGREDVFRLAEKLTRHASEVDVYHIGKYKGMGSRHNVSHWGCPCKEARIAMAHHHRVYYYLTGDRRLEDIFDELKDNEVTFLNRDPLGDFYNKDEMVYPSHARSGPDWSSLCSNWLTQWERTNDTTYRKKIEIGSEDIKNAPLKLISGHDFEFDPDSLHLRYIGEKETGGQHLQICMGAPTIWLEMAELMGDEEWNDMLASLGDIYFRPYKEQREMTNGLIGKRQFTYPMFAGGLGAYASFRKKDESIGKNVWKVMLSALLDLNNEDGFAAITLENTANHRELSEIPWISTNYSAQYCLNTIIALEFIRELLPENLGEAAEMIGEKDVNENFRKA